MKGFAVFLITTVILAIISVALFTAVLKSPGTTTTSYVTVYSSTTDFVTGSSSEVSSTVDITYVQLFFQGNYYNLSSYGFVTSDLNSYFAVVFTMSNNGIQPSPGLISSISVSSGFAINEQEVCAGASISSCSLTGEFTSGVFMSYPVGILQMANECSLPCSVPNGGVSVVVLYVQANFGPSGYEGPLTITLS